MTMAHDLLDEPLLTWRDREGNRGMTTLPGILRRLGSGELVDFPRTRAHQFDPWSMFLTQLAAIALHRAGGTDPRLSEHEWKGHLLALTDGSHEPWCLVVTDLAKPAFFQAPVPEGKLDDWKIKQRPDDLDILVTSKAHDVKTGLVDASETEAWVYALTALQTMQGYSGPSLQSISRMKSGSGNRPRVSVAANPSPAGRFARDLRVMLDNWPNQLGLGYSDNGIALVWTRPWDGSDSLAMEDLCPYFVEICRRTRLRSLSSGLEARYTTTDVRRCLPNIEDGDVGDPWIPIKRDGGALTISDSGFDYKKVTELLFSGQYKKAAAQDIKVSDGDPVFLLASAMPRGMGETGGLHERRLVISGAARGLLGRSNGADILGKRAVAQVEQTASMIKDVLEPSLRALFQIDEKKRPSKKNSGGGGFEGFLRATRKVFSHRVDEIFFTRLLGDVDQPDDDARLAWEQTVKDIASAELQRAIERSCVPDVQRYKAISDAERKFRGCLKFHFPDLVAATAGGDDKEATP